MKPLNLITICILIAGGSLFAQNDDCSIKSFPKCKIGDNNLTMSVRGGDIILENKNYRRESIEITEEYDLYINRRRVKLSGKQRNLTKSYYHQTMRIIDKAKDIGWEGAKVGVEGAKLGIKAIAGVIRLLSPDYDTDDFERDMDRESRKIEEKAKRLEEKAEGIEEMADELEEKRVEMKRHIREPRKVHWF